jgi:hypothetical protein
MYSTTWLHPHVTTSAAVAIMGTDEGPLLSAAELSDKDVAKAMVAGRVFWSGNVASDLWLYIRTNHPEITVTNANKQRETCWIIIVFEIVT